jgi:hypothetical protein
MTSRLRVALLVLAASFPLAAAPPASREPALLVVISVDGLSWERLSSWRPWYRAGLARLLSEGRVETAARYEHLNTETGPGHASLGTGAPPRVHGIVTNEWYEEAPDGTLGEVYCTDQRDPDAPEGAGTKPIPGPANLRVATLGDRLLEARPGARVVSLSGKDRGAIFLAGRRREHAVFWYDAKNGTFKSSKAYDTSLGHARAVAEIVEHFGRSPAGGLRARFGRLWTRLPVPNGTDTAVLPQPERDISLFQLPSLGLGFPHVYEKDPGGYFAGIYHSPAIDETLAELALAVIRDPRLALGRGKGPDLLCLSFSAEDTVSHWQGNESEENLDVLRRLDVQLGRLLGALDEKVGKGRVLLALSADHGFSPIPELRKKRGEPAGRLVFGKETVIRYVSRINRRLDEILCLDPGAAPIAGSDGQNLYYTKKKLRTVAGTCGPADAEVGAGALDAVLPRAIHELFAEEVEEVLLVSQAASWGDGAAAGFARNDLFPSRSGDAFLIPKKGVIIHWDPVRGSSHGSHYDESTHVPLVFWGTGVTRGDVDVPSTPYDLAPTLAAHVGVTLPEATGRALPLN